MNWLLLTMIVFSFTACASGTMEVTKCLPGELGCKKQVYAKFYRGEQMTPDGSLRLIVAAALGERDVSLCDQILYSVGTKAEAAGKKNGNIKLYVNNMTGQPSQLYLGELHVVMNDNNQRYKMEARLELGPYETRELAVLSKDIENLSTKFVVKAFLRYNDQEEEVDVSVNRLSVEQLKQIQSLERPL